MTETSEPIPSENQSGHQLISPFLRTCRGLSAQTTPIWIPIRTGSILPVQRTLLDKQPISKTLNDPLLIKDITLHPLQTLDLDAVLLFSDSLLPLAGMGLKLNGEHPGQLRLTTPINTPQEIDLLGAPPAEEHLAPMLEAVKVTQATLAEKGPALVGWTEAPFTLAVRSIGNLRQEHHHKLKRFLYHEPAAWKRLMEKLVTITGDALLKQAEAGVDALTVFDPFSGHMLSDHDLHRHVLPYHQHLFHKLKHVKKPVVFHTSLPLSHLEQISTWCDVISLDFRHSWSPVRDTIGQDHPLQINLDAALLSAPWFELKAQIMGLLPPSQQHIIISFDGQVPPRAIDDNIHRLIDTIHHLPHARHKGTNYAADDHFAG